MKQTKNFKTLSRFEKCRIRGGNTEKGRGTDKDKDKDSEGGVPPYEPGGNKDKDKDK